MLPILASVPTVAVLLLVIAPEHPSIRFQPMGAKLGGTAAAGLQLDHRVVI